MSQLNPKPPTPPLLLTKRLNAFLHTNQSAQLPTLLLTTAHGKLLAHASPHAVALLRTHATVAASLLAIHTLSSVGVPSALPGARSPDPIASSPVAGTYDEDDDSEESADENRLQPAPDHHARARRRGATKPVAPAAVTLQLSGGTVVIRRLKCGLLFVAIGPPAQDYSPEQHAHQHHQHHHHHHHENDEAGGSPSEVESLASAGGQTSSHDSAAAASVVAMRKHAGELARWLDDKLGTLQVPEEDGSMSSDGLTA